MSLQWMLSKSLAGLLASLAVVVGSSYGDAACAAPPATVNSTTPAAFAAKAGELGVQYGHQLLANGAAFNCRTATQREAMFTRLRLLLFAAD